MLLHLPIDEFAEYAEMVVTPQRTYSLELGYPTQLEKEIRIRLPEGWTAALPGGHPSRYGFRPNSPGITSRLVI